MMTRKLVLLLFMIIISKTFSMAQVDPVGKDGIAIGGYDVVAYFKTNAAAIGKPEINYQYKKVTYLFSNEQHRQDFIANPEKFLPQYDGYCALAIGAQRKKVSIDPNTFKITDGKLYLFFNGQLAFSGRKFNSLEPWIKDERDLIQKSDKNWPEIKEQKYKKQ